MQTALKGRNISEKGASIRNCREQGNQNLNQTIVTDDCQLMTETGFLPIFTASNHSHEKQKNTGRNMFRYDVSRQC